MCMAYEIDIISEPATEANRILFTYLKTKCGFYLKHGFYVFPNLLSVKAKYSNKVVVLPQIDYSKLNFFNIDTDTSVLELDTNIFGCFNFSPKLKNLQEKDILYIQNNYPSLLTLNYDKKEILKKFADNTLKIALQKFDYLKNRNLKVNIYLTNYGTCGSFDSVPVTELLGLRDLTLNFFLRTDMPIEAFAELLSSSITKMLVHSSTPVWEHTEAVSDFLTKYIFNNYSYIGTLDSVQVSNTKLLLDSINYLYSLKLNATGLLEYDALNDKIILKNKDITSLFSSYERLLLVHFLSNKGKVITFDDIAKVLYGDRAEINFSLWGINKCIQRVRSKLEKQGVPKIIIKNVKGVGFVF